jgi:tetratricopeptide (TPR) repeat protein
MTDTGPLFVSSGDLIADRRYKWALDHAAQGDFAGAADILAQTVELAPGFATAWFALGAIRDRLGDRDGAIAAFEKARDADPEDYHGARLQLARLGAGEAGPAMTETYVRRLFDQYAVRYDTALPSTLPIAARRSCATQSKESWAPRGVRCASARCSILAAAPGLRAKSSGLLSSG